MALSSFISENLKDTKGIKKIMSKYDWLADLNEGKEKKRHHK